MSKINELIQQLCPKGVEFKKLGDFFKFSNGKGHEKFIDEDGEFIVVNSKFISTNGNVKKYSKSQICPLYVDDILLVMSDLPNGRALGKTYIVEKDNLYTLNQRICSLSVIDKNILNPKFYYYYLNRNYQFLKYNNGVDQTNLRKDDILRITIPIPPIQVQQEIVKILDQFTALDQELNNELQARKQQYNFFLNQLLRFEENKVEWKNLGDLYDFKNGLNKGKEFFGKGTPIINFTDVFKNIYLTKDRLNGLVEVNDTEKIRYKAQKNDLFFTRTSEVKDEIGMSCVLVDDVEDCVFSGFVLRARPKTELHISKFIAYYLRTYDVRTQIIRYSSFTTRGLTSGPKLSKIKIPIISLQEQERIVKILDQFDALVNDTTVGLPAEINARKQQYEYYRNQLLTFKPLD